MSSGKLHMHKVNTQQLTGVVAPAYLAADHKHTAIALNR